jgi:SAM-dependent methyltransferase
VNAKYPLTKPPALAEHMQMPARQPATKTTRPRDHKTACTFCAAELSTPLYTTRSIFEDEFTLHRCLDCRAVFLVPQPSPRQLQQAYADDYYGKGSTKFGPRVEKVLDYFRSARSRKLARYLSPPANVLDVGCGSGRFLKGLLDRGFHACGTELPGKAAERARQIPGLNLKIGHLSETDFADDYFDAVCMWHVFEHLPQPKRTLQIIYKLLRPDGWLFLSLPNIDSLQSRLFRGNWLHLDPPRHLFFLRPADLLAEMRKCGFNLAAQSHLSIEQNIFGFQQSFLNCLIGRRDILFEALKGNLEYTAKYPRWHILGQKAFCLATLPLFAALAALEAALQKGGTIELVFRKSQP